MGSRLASTLSFSHVDVGDAFQFRNHISAVCLPPALFFFFRRRRRDRSGLVLLIDVLHRVVLASCSNITTVSVLQV